MIPVSPEFNTAAEATVRKVDALIKITWASPFIDPAVSASTNDDNRASHIEQTHDGTREIVSRWAHLDGVIKANGQYNPMPNTPNTSPTNQVGWYGKTRCDGSAQWATNPELTITFDPRPVVDLLVVGDSTYQEYPVDFDIDVYEGVTLSYSLSVINNSSVEWSQDVSGEGLNDVTEMRLTIKKWSVPERIVKISEFYTFFQQTFTSDHIGSFGLLEERVLEDGSLPVGNISANELDLAMNNIKITIDGDTIVDPFFPSNPDTPYNDVLIKNRKVEPSLGFKLASGAYEYVKLGTFWTGDCL